MRSRGGFEIADESDLAAMVEQIKATEPPFIGYIYSRPYVKFLVLIWIASGPERSFSTVKDTLVSNNSNVHTLAADWAELEEDKGHPVVISGQQFKSDMAADKYIDTLDHSIERLQGQTNLIKHYEKKYRGIISPNVKDIMKYCREKLRTGLLINSRN